MTQKILVPDGWYTSPISLKQHKNRRQGYSSQTSMREQKDNPKANIASTLAEYHSSLHPRGNDPVRQ